MRAREDLGPRVERRAQGDVEPATYVPSARHDDDRPPEDEPGGGSQNGVSASLSARSSRSSRTKKRYETKPSAHVIEKVRLEDIRRAVRTMVVARAIGMLWALFQVLTYSAVPFPPGVEVGGYGLVAAIGIANVSLFMAQRRIVSLSEARIVALASLAADLFLISGFVWLFAFDQVTASWSILFVLPLEGAILFSFRGALGAWAVVTLLYCAREVWASGRYGFPIEWNIVTFRMGIALVIALVAGFMARDLVRQRAQLHQAIEEVNRIDRLRAALVSTLAHDVRNPLTTIRGVHRTLLAPDRKVDPEKVQELLKIADRQSERLQRLAIDLLDLARLEEGRLELSLQKVPMRSAVEGAISYLEGGERFKIDVEEDLSVRADPDRLQQIIVNLAGNTLRYGQEPFSVEGRRVDGKACLSFIDHGRGLPEELQPSVFEAFRTVGKKGSVGFGLAIVKALVEAQDGEVSYEDLEPQGACFRVLLPLA